MPTCVAATVAKQELNGSAGGHEERQSRRVLLLLRQSSLLSSAPIPSFNVAKVLRCMKILHNFQY